MRVKVTVQQGKSRDVIYQLGQLGVLGAWEAGSWSNEEYLTVDLGQVERKYILGLDGVIAMD